MKDASLVQLGHATWQTPRHGDFARYVEELTGGQASVTLDEPGRVPRLSERTASVASAPSRRPFPAPAKAHSASDGSGEFADMGHAIGKVLSAIRWGLLLITLIQIGLFMVLSLGSVVGVGASLLGWWLVGRLKQAMEGMRASGPSPDNALAKIRSELQARVHAQRGAERRP